MLHKILVKYFFQNFLKSTEEVYFFYQQIRNVVFHIHNCLIYLFIYFWFDIVFGMRHLWYAEENEPILPKNFLFQSVAAITNQIQI